VSKLVLGVALYRHVPPAGVEAGVTAGDIANALGMHVRSVQRHLVSLELAGLVRREGPSKPARWWRA
jgi:predicted ArsR family transcriptional regulator